MTVKVSLPMRKVNRELKLHAVGPLKAKQEKIITDDTEAANIMNNYFSNIFTVEDLTNIPEAANVFHGLSDADKLENFEINEEQVKIN